MKAITDMKEESMTKAAQNETFHRLTIAAMIGSLENLDRILVKAEAHARARQN